MGVRKIMVCAQGVKRAGDDGNRSVVWYRNPLQEEQREWASMAPELLCLILRKVQERRGEQGEGRRIVACAGVCRSWRRQVHHFCHTTICHTPYIQFPSSLSQPGPILGLSEQPAPVQCVVRRKGGVITLYHGEHRQFMLAARRNWRPGGCTFAISSHPRCFSERGKALMAKLKANFWASEFVLWDADHEKRGNSSLRSPLAGIYFSEDVIDGVRQRRIACVLIPPGQSRSAGASTSCSDISVPFALPRSQSLSWSSCQSVLPRSVSKGIQTSLARSSVSRSSSIRVLSRSGSLSHPIPPVGSALVLPSSQAPQQRARFLTACFAPSPSLHSGSDNGERGDVVMDGEAHYQMMLAAARGRKIARFESLVTAGAAPEQAVRQGHANCHVVPLSSKIPEWDPQQHCWSLDFKGRASLPSLHNFQLLVDGVSGSERPVMQDLRKDGAVVLQLGKIGKGLYTMDYAFPLTAVQAFAICISSFSTSVGLDP